MFGSDYVDKEGEEGAYEGKEAGEGEVAPGVAGGELAVGEGGGGVGEDVDEGGGEDDPRGEALDEEEGVRIGLLAMEHAGEENREGYADGAGGEDDGERDQLQVGRGEAVAAPGGAGQVGGGGDDAARHKGLVRVVVVVCCEGERAREERETGDGCH